MKTTLSAAVLLLGTFVSVGGVEALELYDTFKGVRVPGIKGKVLDPSRWSPWGTEDALEVVRSLRGGYVILATTSHGQPDTDIGRVQGRSYLVFPESTGALITEMQATVQTRKIGLTDCAGNTNTSSLGRVVTPRMAGMFFRDSTPINGEDKTGNVDAELDIRRFTDPADPEPTLKEPKRLEVVARLWHCGNFNCSAGVTLDWAALGNVKRGQKRRIRIKWDEAESRFLFQLHNNDPIELTYDPNLNVQPPPRYWKRIHHGGRALNCDLSGGAAVQRAKANGEVRVFDVHVNAEAIPD